MGALDDLAAQRAGGASASASPLEALAAKKAPAQTTNPFASDGQGGTLPLLSGSSAKKVVSGVSKVLDAQRWGVAKAFTGETDPERQTDAQYRALGVDRSHENPFERAVSSFAMQTVADPLTYETLGVGAIPKAAAKFGKLGLEAVDRVPLGLGRLIYDKLHWGGEVARTHGTQTLATVRGAANVGANTGEMVQNRLMAMANHVIEGKHVQTGKVIPGKALTEQERVRVAQALNGEIAHEIPGTLTPKEESAVKQLRRLTELDFKMRSDVQRKLAFQEASRGLSAEEKQTLLQALNRGVEPAVPGATKRVKTAVEGSPESVASRTRAIHDPTAPHKAAYTMPIGNAEEIAKAQKLNDLYHQINLRVEQQMPRRENYLPWTHADTAAEAGGTEARKVNLFERPDPHSFEREDVQVTNASQLSRGMHSMATNAGRQVERGIVHEALADLVDKPEIRKLFDTTIRATGNKRTDSQKVADTWLTMVGYPRAATVSLLPRHGVNILDLLANTVGPTEAPAALKRTMELATKLVLAKSEAEYARLTKSGRELGALSGSYRERKPFFQEFSDAKVPEQFLGMKPPSGMVGKPVLGPLAGKPTDVTIGGHKLGLGAWTRMSNKMTWAVDEAAKQVYAEMMHASGEAKGLEAGGLASGRLVDYAHRTPLTEALKWVAPFGTFRGSIPGAVAGGIARSPARAAALNRATGGAMYGDKPGPGGIQLQNPTADVGRIPNYDRGTGKRRQIVDSGLSDYARATLSAPAKGILNAGQDVLGVAPTQPHIASYGQPWLPKKDKHGKLDLGFVIDSALAGVPQAQTILEQFGIGHFQAKGMGREMLRQALGVEVK